jgi:hypothetical protein
MSCSLGGRYQRFGGIWHIHLHDRRVSMQENEGRDLWRGLLFYPEDGDSRFLHDIGTILLNWTHIQEEVDKERY